ncbi:OmpA family protein [Arenimonas fontis]|uniref:OmpA family protein n=1 Tax=Arenimonas fontis TaxID=2608255 RepID=A0A5B2ZE62_9GAMM|nr:OmpA family protein [Arenimonas fontis]KAA2286299.1 OmpA family protein [Arenimonas fontis]
MKKNLLCCALLGAMAMANTAMAQEFDDRWYVSGGLGMNLQDSDRDTKDVPYATLGLGKFISPKWSLDFELNYQNPVINGTDLWFSQYGATVDARYHMTREGRNWWPYLRFGIGAQRVEEEFDAFPNPNSPGERSDTFMTGTFGIGLQADYDRYAVRGELAMRHATDDSSVVAPGKDGFTDVLAGVTLLVKLGELAKPVEPEPEVPQVTCADLDDDGDGVNNCDDRCPGSQAGQAIGPDGCPVPLTIDLKGVNFDFDKDTLRPDAIAILDEAIAILQKYPQLRVEVAGHTDSIGTEQYNQGLSERRAKAVYDYLINAGISAGRLVGPNGYGESRPIDTNDTREGRARNRRTELNVQN